MKAISIEEGQYSLGQVKDDRHRGPERVEDAEALEERTEEARVP